MTFDPVTLATPFFILLVIAEILAARYAKTRTNYEARDTATSLAMGLGSTVAGVLIGGLVAGVTLWSTNTVSSPFP